MQLPSSAPPPAEITEKTVQSREGLSGTCRGKADRKVHGNLWCMLCFPYNMKHVLLLLLWFVKNCVNLLSVYPKISRKSSILGPILSLFWVLGPTWADLGPPWDLNDEDVHSKPPFLRILSPKGDPIRDPKITLGASMWPSELPRTSFGGEFLRTYFLHKIRPPKLTQKVVFFGPLYIAKT